MDSLLLAARKYEELLGKFYVYTLENGSTIQVYFAPGFFHYLLGLQKIKDIPLAVKSPENSTTYLYRNIIKGIIQYGCKYCRPFCIIPRI